MQVTLSLFKRATIELGFCLVAQISNLTYPLFCSLQFLYNVD